MGIMLIRLSTESKKVDICRKIFICFIGTVIIDIFFKKVLGLSIMDCHDLKNNKIMSFPLNQRVKLGMMVQEKMNACVPFFVKSDFI